ncbi:MAG: protoporphyrinogen oxidase [Alphaproteobacteria bacterium]|nr:protoporphyrinogen oxidase [Alphaproteobacteria bacterium]
MRFLVLYGTTEGQTRKIADFVTTKLKDRGDIVAMIDAADVPWDMRPQDYDAAILAGSLHAGVYQTPLIHFARKHHEALNNMPTAFLSVSLSAGRKDAEDLRGMTACADRFQKDSGWKPSEVHHVAGAFRFAEYDFFKHWMMKVIAWERGMKTAGVVELELTDWDALRHIVGSFHERAAAAPKHAA